MTRPATPTKPNRPPEFDRALVAVYPKAIAYGRKLSGSEEAGQELAQAAVARALRFWDHFELGTSMISWLCTILFHAFIVQQRHKRFVSLAVSDEQWMRLINTQHSPDDPGRLAATNEALSRIDDLTPEKRVALVLAALGHSYEEIADYIGVPVGTAKSRVSRARDDLAAKIAA